MKIKHSILNFSNVLYVIKGDIARAKQVIIITENILGLTRLSVDGADETQIGCKQDNDFNKDIYRGLIKQIQGKTIDHIVASNNSSSGFDLVFTDGSVLEFYADKLSLVFEENPLMHC